MSAVMPIRNDGTDATQLAHALESEQQRAERMARVVGLGQALSKTRSEAIQGRQSSGV